MLIIVEGPDLAGKSTLVAEIVGRIRGSSADRSLRLYHKKPPRRPALAEYLDPLLGYRPGQGVDIVCDRWHWGELVYPTVLERATTMTRGIRRYLDLFLMSRGAVVVYAHAARATITERHRVRGDELLSLYQIHEAAELYRGVAASSALPVVRADPRWTAEETADAIVRDAINVEKTALALNPFHTYVGPRRPSLLLLGDTRPRRMLPDAGAFYPSANSGHFLMQSLVHPLTRTAGLLNVNDVDDWRKAYDVLGRPRTVVLGREAQKTVGATIGSHGIAPHPQFVRRFYHHHGAEYGAIIRDAWESGADHLKWRPANSWSSR